MVELGKFDLVKETSVATGICEKRVATALELVEEGCTISFIARYRKEKTEGLDEVEIARIIDVSEKIEALNKRKHAVIKSLFDTGSYTDELGKMVSSAVSMTELEDIYDPYRPGRKTRSDKAVEAGLEPLAELILSDNLSLGDVLKKGVSFVCDAFPTAKDVAGGAKDIIAQKVSDNLDVRSFLRDDLKKGVVFSKVKRGKKEKGATYRDYFQFSEPVLRIAPHRIMAISRGEKEGFLNVGVNPFSSLEKIGEKITALFFGKKGDFFLTCSFEALERLLLKSLETEILNDLKDMAIEASLEYFHRNLEQIISAPPFGEKMVIGIDPGIRTGCKAVLLDGSGNYIESLVLYLHSDKTQVKKLDAWVEKHEVKGIAIGNGTFGRETFELVKIHFGSKIVTALVNEDGASIYSASSVGREEFPDLDVTVRGAVSIGRRFQDPLSELVKISPESLGVGQYQHDIPQKMLSEKLKRTVEWVVNRVGVNLNTASPYILSYVSGLDLKKSKEVVNNRKNRVRFTNLNELKSIKGIGPKSFEQCAGFLRITDGSEILDSTGVHPENYPDVKKAASMCNVTMEKLVQNPEIVEKNYDAKSFLTASIISELKKKGLDPREKFESTAFSDSIRTITDLKESMVLNGVVDNIVAFGAFIDIGIKEKGLLHISEISDQYVKDPGDYLFLGQKIKVSVIHIDFERKRISLTMKI